MSNKTSSKGETIYFAGIDGGGTKTTVAIANEKGTILSIDESGPSRLASVPDEKAKEEIEKALFSAVAQAGINLEDIAAVGWGVGGLDTKSDRKKANDIIERIIPPGTKARIEDDAVIGLFSGTFGDSGVSIIAGTGSLIAGISSTSRRARVDGWGYLFGDLGSAFYIGKKAIQSVLEAHDGRGPNTELKEMVMGELELNSPEEIIDHFYPLNDSPRRIARYSKIVDRAAKRGDKVAIAILNSAAGELVRSAEVLIEELSLQNREKFPIVLVGGVFNSKKVRKEVKSRLKKSFEANVIRPDWPPVIGAIVAGMKEIESEIDEKVRSNLKQN
jgi:N-acetylglucosamine kinase-like BadF-type ATPase